MADNFKYPLPKFHFEVAWGGTRMGFTEVTGLDFETEVIEYREGNSPTYNKRRQPGLTKYSNVTLKRGTVIQDFEFFKLWRETGATVFLITHALDEAAMLDGANRLTIYARIVFPLLKPAIATVIIAARAPPITTCTRGGWVAKA